MTTVQKLYEDAFHAGKEVQTKEHSGETVDGRAIWNTLESTTKKLKDRPLTNNANDDGEILHYNSSLKPIYREMNDIIVRFGMDKSEFDPKSNHFFCQLMNLVDKKSNFEIKLNKIMQLGFNAGQISVFLERNTLPGDRLHSIAGFIKKNNMLNLDTYVSRETQETINRLYLSGFNGNGGGKRYLKNLKIRRSRQNKRGSKNRRVSQKRRNISRSNCLFKIFS